MNNDQKSLFPGISKWMGEIISATKCGAGCSIAFVDIDKVVIENDEFSIGFMIPRDPGGKVNTARLARRAKMTAVAWCRTIFESRLEPYL